MKEKDANLQYYYLECYERLFKSIENTKFTFLIDKTPAPHQKKLMIVSKSIKNISFNWRISWKQKENRKVYTNRISDYVLNNLQMMIKASSQIDRTIKDSLVENIDSFKNNVSKTKKEDGCKE